MYKLSSTVVILVLLGLFFSQCYWEYQKIYPQDYIVRFFDVELGDACLIQTPAGKTILIDSSSDGRISEKITNYLSFFDKSLDLFILSHGDSDHVGGAAQILKQFQVKQVFFNGADKKSPMYQEFLNLLYEKKISYKILEKNKDYRLDSNIILNTIFPFSNISYLEDQGNNESLVFFISIFDKKILFTGDIEKEVETTLFLSGQNLEADILKVPHHGSQFSSSDFFLKAVNPRYAVVQAAIGNSFNHPHPEVITRYEYKNIKFLQTGNTKDLSFCINEKKAVFERCVGDIKKK